MARNAKVKSGAKKRFRKTGSGIIKFRRADRAHGNTKVSGDIHTLQSLPQLTHCYVHHTDITGHMQKFFDYRKNNGLDYCLAILYNRDDALYL